MQRFKTYLIIARKLIENYHGKEPLSIYLKKSFSENKKLGSRDRKHLATLCYNFYRVGHTLEDLSIEDKIIAATFLCEQERNEFLQFYKPHWNALIEEPAEKKIAITRLNLNINDVFPYAEELSESVDFADFCKSFLIQPNLFLRIRLFKKILFERIEKLELPYQVINNNECIVLPNGAHVEEVVDIDREVVIQDFSSQQVLNYLRKKEVLEPLRSLMHFEPAKNSYVYTAWDCCAASGGKSILLYDILKRKVELTVSDIRLNILLNLHKRFRKAAIKKYNYFVADLCSDELPIDTKYSIVLCDVPCTGSGTWSRTPEQLYYFDKKLIAEYSKRQKKIVSHTIPFLQKDGLYIYITCSVFKQENEVISNFIQKKFSLKLLHQELIKGYDKKADTMFVAVFRK